MVRVKQLEPPFYRANQHFSGAEILKWSQNFYSNQQKLLYLEKAPNKVRMLMRYERVQQAELKKSKLEV